MKRLACGDRILDPHFHYTNQFKFKNTGILICFSLPAGIYITT